MPLFRFLNTQAKHIKSIELNSNAAFSLKTLAGFEPGSSEREADAMSTVPRRQGNH
jgi:hypothetical protein